VAVISGKFQFKVKVLENPGVCLIGWCTSATKPLYACVVIYPHDTGLEQCFHWALRVEAICTMSALE
jgi:hypothetical protein